MSAENKSIYEEQYKLQENDTYEEMLPPMLYGRYTKRKNTMIRHRPGDHILTRFVLNKYNLRETEVNEDGSWIERTICRIPKECEEETIDLLGDTTAI